MVLVDQPTEDLAPLDSPGPGGPRAWGRAPDLVRGAKAEPAMGPIRVVVRSIRMQHSLQVSSTQDQHVIERLASDASDQSLHVTVGLGGPVGREHDVDATRGEDGIEAPGVLRVAVAEQEADAEPGVVVQIHDQVASLLGHPGLIRVGAHPDPEDPPRLDVHEHQDVQGLWNTVSTVKKSEATMPLAWAERN